MRKLDILVPMYNESEDVIRPLLDSIAIQQNVNLAEDVGVIVCCDGGTARLSDELMAEYPFHIEFHMREHEGVAATRNACLDLSEAEYVIFSDCDDMLCHACGLYIVFNEIEVGFDTLTSAFVEETRHPETKEPLYVNHDMDSTFVHGKVHRRGYLLDEGIRFDPSLTIHEDSYFNILAQNIANPERAKYCPTPWYLWKWRDASVCRHDPDYILKTYGNMLDSNDALVREFERRGRHDKAREYACFMIFDAYYTMNKKEWLDKTHADYRDAVEHRFARYFAEHRELWDELPEAERMLMSNGVRSRSVMEGMPMETVTIGAWLDHVSAI